MTRMFIYGVVGSLLLFSGCASHPTDPKITFAPPKYVDELPSREDEQIFATAGSLYGQGDNPLFSDRKAMNVNDIVTVVIDESTISSSTGKKSIKESDNANFGIGANGAVGGNIQYGGTNKLLQNTADTINSVTSLGFKSGGSSEFSGAGSNTRNESFTTTISARIIKVLNNGNYYIEGGRELLIDGEKQMIRVSGVIRPYDISQGNTIDSKYIADARVYYETEGDIKKSTSKAWGTKFVESIWPF